jgi:hypothetical protein
LVSTRFGVFLLWLGWFGFNGGSVLSADPKLVSLVFVATSLAAASGISTDTPVGFNDNFGHFEVGAAVAVPLGRPEACGSWELTG